MHHLATRQPTPGGQAFVTSHVVTDIRALPILAPPPSEDKAQCQEVPVAVRMPRAKSEAVAPRSGGFVETGSGGKPIPIFQSRPLQQREGTLEQIPLAHVDLSRKRSPTPGLGSAPSNYVA